ncbi:rhodanese-related sulfurtransferase [Balneicella halophila]|uniref:Rhodanese-related sulfurtransferase n=1 Tax=Balneicella halophila TaxID=1537566 RepID=A0A7L4UMT8_BALHA|nr:rhodanese-like domain-containing protein [Balneicella halophila]PVX49852.1 rhodanese-related sulfurtransferase [Balneicella halophila]
MLKKVLTLIITLLPVLLFSQDVDENIKTGKQIVQENKDKVTQISAEQLHEMIESGENITILDVRTEKERMIGHINNSKWIPRGMLEFKVQEVLKDADADIVVYCKSGGRSLLSATTLKELGYKNVFILSGGIKSWRKNGYLLCNENGMFQYMTIEK